MRIRYQVAVMFLVIGLCLCFPLNASAKIVNLEEEQYKERLGQLEKMVEQFRGDPYFVYYANCGLTKEQRIWIEETYLPQFYEEKGADTTEKKIQAVVELVRENLAYDSYEDIGEYKKYFELLTAYEFLHDGKPANGKGNSSNFAQIVQTLLALSGIPSFEVADHRNVTGYVVVMAYVGTQEKQWVYIDAPETADLMDRETFYETSSGHFQPGSVEFGYGSSWSWLYLANIYICKEAMKEDIYSSEERHLCYDSASKSVLFVGGRGAPIANTAFYGAAQRVDDKGRVPHGFITCRTNDGRTENGQHYWVKHTAYSQFGVVLKGEVTINGVDYNFERSSLYTLQYSQKEEYIPSEEEIAAIQERISGRYALMEKIAEDIMKNGYQRFYDNTPEEMAYLQGIVDEVTCVDYLRKNEFDMNVWGLPIPEEDRELTDWEKATALQHYIRRHIVSPESNMAISYQNSYETLQQGVGVCANFAAVMRDLANLAGIPCFRLTSSLRSHNLDYPVADHEIVMLKLDGTWYYADTTNSNKFWPMDGVYSYWPAGISYAERSTRQIFLSYEIMLADATLPDAALCYGYDDEDELGIYYMDRTGPIANYNGSTIRTDENGRLLQTDGIVTWEWEETVREERNNVSAITGYQTWEALGYLSQGMLVPGTQTIDGETYEFPRETVAGDSYIRKHRLVRELSRIDYLNITGIPDSVEYTGQPIYPEPVIVDDKKNIVLEKDKHYTVTYGINRDVVSYSDSEGSIQIEGIESAGYTYHITYYFDITPFEIKEEDAVFPEEDLTWSIEMDKWNQENGTRHKAKWPVPEIKNSKLETGLYYLSNNGDDIVYSFAHTITVSLKPKPEHSGGCKGTLSKSYEVKPLSLDEEHFKVSLSQDSYAYDGTVPEPEVTVEWLYDDGTVYRELDSDEYVVQYPTIGSSKPGTKEITIMGNGCFIGEITTEYEIVRKDIAELDSLKEAFFSDAGGKTRYTGEPVTPYIRGITAGYANLGLTKDKDFTVEITDNVNVGDAKIVMTGIGDYTGTLERTVPILPKTFNANLIRVNWYEVEWTGEVQIPEIVAEGLEENTDFTVTFQQEEPAGSGNYVDKVPKDAGIYSVRLEMINPNYIFDVRDEESGTWTESKIARLYYGIHSNSGGGGIGGNTGGAGGSGGNSSGTGGNTGGNTGSTGGNSGGNTGGTGDVGGTTGGTSGGDDGGVTYTPIYPEREEETSSGNTGTGDSSGKTSEEDDESDEKPVDKVPKVENMKLKVPAVKKKGNKRTLTLGWKRAKTSDTVSGYQVQISTNKKYKKAKTINVAGSKTGCKISGLKKNKTYYIRIRGYKQYTVNGKKKKAYGKWKKQTVRT